MKILVDITHPAHVHFFKNMIWNLEKSHEIKITARDKDVTLDLLDAYGFEYDMVGEHKVGIGKAFGLIKRDYKLYKIAKKFNPDIMIGIHNMYAAQVGKLIRKPSITFTDTEHGKINDELTYPFTDIICTPSCFKKDLGAKQVRYNGYHELAYLHPKYFKPNLKILDDLNLNKDEKIILVRLVSWKATHDMKQKGFDSETIQILIKKLGEYGRIFISSENRAESEGYKIPISPEEIHSFLYHANLYVGEGATMATEAGLLGTPSIYISPLVGTMGNFEELEKKYQLVYSFRDPNQALEKTLKLLENENLKNEWKKKREKLLEEKIDVTKFITEFIENYPESFENYKKGRK